MLDPQEGYVDPLAMRLVDITNACQNFNALPHPGGILQQDALTVIGMNMVLSAQEKKRELEAQKKNRNK